MNDCIRAHYQANDAILKCRDIYDKIATIVNIKHGWRFMNALKINHMKFDATLLNANYLPHKHIALM